MQSDDLVNKLEAKANSDFQILKRALERKDWGEAVTYQVEWLFSRTWAISAKIGVEYSPRRATLGIAGDLAGLRAACVASRSAWRRAPEPQDRARKLDGIVETLDAIHSLLKSFKAYGAQAPNGPAMLALAGSEIGRAEVLLSLVESGHWERVVDLEAKHERLFGGSRRRRPQWEQAFEVEAIKIAAGKPVKRADLVRAARIWDQTYRIQHKGLGLPATEKGIGEGIDKIASTGVITLTRKV